MRISRAVLFIACCVALGACQAVSPSQSVAARLQAPSKEVRQQLSEVTAKMLGLSSITLDEHTLTNSSQFVIARTPRYDASGQLLQGRVIEPGHIFKLVLRNGECWLRYENKDQQALLSLAHCIAQ